MLQESFHLTNQNRFFRVKKLFHYRIKMTSIKVRFHIANEASPSDVKTNVKMIKSVQRLDEPVVWVFPPEHQPMSMHPELVKSSTMARGLAQIDKRHKMKKILVSLNDEIKKISFDDDLNFCFRDQLLDDKPIT